MLGSVHEESELDVSDGVDAAGVGVETASSMVSTDEENM